MSSHAAAFVPIEAWTYSSPEQRERGRSVDIGLLAESLLYYDQIVIDLNEGAHLAELVNWFAQHDQLATLLSMMDDRTLRFHGYKYFFIPFKSRSEGVVTSSVMTGITPECFPIAHAFSDEFASRFNYDYFLNRFRSLLRDRFILSTASDFPSCLDDARRDIEDQPRCEIVFQAFIDKLYDMRGSATDAQGRDPTWPGNRNSDDRPGPAWTIAADRYQSEHEPYPRRLRFKALVRLEYSNLGRINMQQND